MFCKTRRLKIIPVDSIIGEIPSIESPSGYLQLLVIWTESPDGVPISKTKRDLNTLMDELIVVHRNALLNANAKRFDHE